MGICDPAVAPTVKTGMGSQARDCTVTCESCRSMRMQWDTIQALRSTHHCGKWDLLPWHPHFVWLSKVHAWLFRHYMVQSGGMAKHDITEPLLAFNAKAFPARKSPALPHSPHNVELSSIQLLGENQDLARETLSPLWEHVLIYGIIPYYGRAKTLNVCFKNSIKFQYRSVFIQKPINKCVSCFKFALYLFASGFTVPIIVISMRGTTPPGRAIS